VLRDVLLQALIWFEAGHLPVGLSGLETSKRLPAPAKLGVEESNRMMDSCHCLTGHTGALKHELEDVLCVTLNLLIRS
jgi:hypothetical protein